MKIYTIDQDLEVKVFPSRKVFEATESYLDGKYIHIMDKTTLLDIFEFPYEKGMIVYSEKQIAAKNIMHGIAIALRGDL